MLQTGEGWEAYLPQPGNGSILLLCPAACPRRRIWKPCIYLEFLVPDLELEMPLKCHFHFKIATLSLKRPIVAPPYSLKGLDNSSWHPDFSRAVHICNRFGCFTLLCKYFKRCLHLHFLRTLRCFTKIQRKHRPAEACAVPVGGGPGPLSAPVTRERCGAGRREPRFGEHFDLR